MDEQLCVQQMSLLPAGCQPWNNNMIAARNQRFAYCASLAVYFYEVCLFLMVLVCWSFAAIFIFYAFVPFKSEKENFEVF